MSRTQRPISTLEWAALGAVAGVVAAGVTTAFQTAWGRAHLPPTAQSPAVPPPTETVAEDVCRAVTGRDLPPSAVGPAGAVVHYLMGAALGAFYGVAVGAFRFVGAGRGLAYGLGIWGMVEECGLYLLGVKPPPWEVEPAEHAFAASSHLVFGFSLDAILAALAPRPFPPIAYVEEPHHEPDHG